MNLISPLNFVANKILYLWIKTDIAHISDSLLEQQDAITIYVLESRAWTDLLVLEHECKSLRIERPMSRIRHRQLNAWHQVYTIAQAQPLKAWLQQKTKHSSMLSGIYQALKKNPELEINFVPVVIFWGRPVLKQKHWIRVLFSETWGIAGRTRRFFTILFNGKNTLLQFSPAISYRNLINNTGESEDSIDKLQSLLTARLTDVRTATLGPDISHRRTLVRKLLANKYIASAILDQCKRDNISEYKATRIANNYLNEIVADRSYITIQILQRILTTFWNKFYSGIDIHFSEQLQPLALSHELIYVPCHRSHIDYLLLSYVIYHESLAIPYIAAGKNLNMPVIGRILRKGGAFFIRRNFKGNDLYSTVMFEYLASQVSTGMPIEYFIEGGRSRTGRLLQPRPGMLAMTIRAFLKYQHRPIAFVPVHIGYEKMIEGKAYLAELAGDEKMSESLVGSIRSFFNIRGAYGRATVSFGKPVLLNAVMDEQYAKWRKRAYDDSRRPDWLRPVVTSTSNQIMQRINECCAVNPVNLIATALLAAQNQTMDEGELKRTLSFYTRLIKNLDYSEYITLTRFDAKQQIFHAEALKLVRRRKHEMGDFIYLDNANAVLLTYYRNNILHLFVMPSLIACCFINEQTLDRKKVIQIVKIAYPFLKEEFFLPWNAAELENVIGKLLSELNRARLLTSKTRATSYSKPSVSTETHAQLATLSQVISPVLELYFMIFALLAKKGSGELSHERLEDLCYLMAQRLSLMYKINSPDFFDKKLIGNFISSLIKLNYVVVNQSGGLEMTEEAAKKGFKARRLLSKNMQHNILQMLHTVTEQGNSAS